MPPSLIHSMLGVQTSPFSSKIEIAVIIDLACICGTRLVVPGDPDFLRKAMNPYACHGWDIYVFAQLRYRLLV